MPHNLHLNWKIIESESNWMENLISNINPRCCWLLIFLCCSRVETELCSKPFNGLCLCTSEFRCIFGTTNCAYAHKECAAHVATGISARARRQREPNTTTHNYNYVVCSLNRRSPFHNNTTTTLLFIRSAARCTVYCVYHCISWVCGWITIFFLGGVSQHDSQRLSHSRAGFHCAFHSLCV